MKKNLVRLVAIALLAVMLISALPAYAAIVGTINSSTPMYQRPDSSSSVVANVRGGVTINYESNDGQFYQVTVTSGSSTVTGWVAKSAVSGVGTVTNTSPNATGSGASTTTPSTINQTYYNTVSASTGTYTGTLSSSTMMYDDDNKAVASVRGNVVVNYRDASGSKLHITATGSGLSISGWVSASAVSNLNRTGYGSATLSSIPTTSAAASGSYTPYAAARNGVSNDSTIYIRRSANSSTSSSNVVSKVTGADGLSFTVLGQDSTGSWLYVNYNGAQGFVRAKDFTVSAATGTTGTTTSTPAGTTSTGTTYTQTQTAISLDSTIYIRRSPDKSTSSDNVVYKLRNADGVAFTLLGESGDWYYAQYNNTYTGYVRKQDFSVASNTAAATNPVTTAATSSTTTSGTPAGVGSGSSSERWGSFTVPGAATYPIYGNYTNKAGNLYYYDHSNIGSYNYLHTTTARNSQIQVVMGHNMRSSRTYFHNLHHIQNALRGSGSCESCGRSCSTSTYSANISATLDGYSKWVVMCLYEVGKGQSTSILQYNAQPWKSNTSSYINTQLQYAKTSGYKGWVNPNVSYTANGKYMMLITCGDKYDSSSNSTAKLYVLLKAVS